MKKLFSGLLKRNKPSHTETVIPDEVCGNNLWMKRFEIKEPDLDFVYRQDAKYRDKTFESLRYQKSGDVWKQRKEKGAKKDSATIMFTGDITCFDNQFTAAETEDGYDFRYEFAEMRKVFRQADLVVGNIETGIVPDAPYRSEKIVIEENFYCNAPLEFLEALRWCGYDMLTNANNHDIDVGAVGLGETIDSIERFGFIHTGTFKTDKKRYEIIDVNGIRIAVTAFATDHNALTCNITPEGQEFMLNDYSKKAARKILKEARQDGAEVVFVCMHWGKENWSEVYKDQYQIADELAELGYDCIIGSHPHVLQEISFIEKGEKSVPVFYSLGNFVSQNYNNIKSRSVVACIDLTRNSEGVSLGCSYIPISTCGKFKGKELVVLPIRSDTARNKNRKKLTRIIEDVGTAVDPDDRFTAKDYKEERTPKRRKHNLEVVDLSKVEKFPFEYTDFHFVFTVYEDHARAERLHEEYRSVSCTIPEQILGLPVTEAAEGMFEGNTHLKKIKAISIPCISSRLCKDAKILEGFRMGMKTREIGESAFEGCTSLYSAVMKKGIKVIGKNAFKGCTNLKSVKLPDGIEHIADDAFDGCSRATFYCEPGSYAEEYAKKHGIPFRHMSIYAPNEDK